MHRALSLIATLLLYTPIARAQITWQTIPDVPHLPIGKVKVATVGRNDLMMLRGETLMLRSCGVWKRIDIGIPNSNRNGLDRATRYYPRTLFGGSGDIALVEIYEDRWPMSPHQTALYRYTISEDHWDRILDLKGNTILDMQSTGDDRTLFLRTAEISMCGNSGDNYSDLLTLDGGATWRSWDTSLDQMEVFDPTASPVQRAWDSIINVRGDQWHRPALPKDRKLCRSISYPIGLATGIDSLLYRFDRRTDTWQEIPLPSLHTAITSLALMGDTIVATTKQGLYYGIDNHWIEEREELGSPFRHITLTPTGEMIGLGHMDVLYLRPAGTPAWQTVLEANVRDGDGTRCIVSSSGRCYTNISMGSKRSVEGSRLIWNGGLGTILASNSKGNEIYSTSYRGLSRIRDESGKLIEEAFGLRDTGGVCAMAVAENGVVAAVVSKRRSAPGIYVLPDSGVSRRLPSPADFTPARDQLTFCGNWLFISTQTGLFATTAAAGAPDRVEWFRVPVQTSSKPEGVVSPLGAEDGTLFITDSLGRLLVSYDAGLLFKPTGVSAIAKQIVLRPDSGIVIAIGHDGRGFYGAWKRGTKEASAEKMLVVAPNPVQNGNTSVRLRNAGDDNAMRRLDLIDPTGRVIGAWNGFSSQWQISTSDLAAGVYLLRVESEDGITAESTLTVVR